MSAGAEILGSMRVWRSQTADADASHTEDVRDVAWALRGDDEAFARLVRRHQREVARLLWRFCRDRAQHEELVQDVFVSAFTSLRTWRDRGSFGAWLRTIAVRTGCGYWRRQRRERVDFRDDLSELLADVPAPSPSAAAEAVQSLLAALGERDRLVLTLLYLEELSVAEIAAATGWSAALVKVQAWRARGRLRQLLEKADER